MQIKRSLLQVKRFKQQGNECAIAAVSSLANFYDPSIVYKDVRRMVSSRMRNSGLYTPQQTMLLNRLGINKVSIVTSDLDIIDYSWLKLTKNGVINKLEKMHKYYSRIDDDAQHVVGSLIKWLADKQYNNNLIIDHDYGKHIRRSIDKGNPVGASVNATSMFKMKKWPQRRGSDIRGCVAEHAVVIRGYDRKNVYVVDSDYGFNRHISIRKYDMGYYKVPWEIFLTNMPNGDLIIFPS